MNVVRPVMVALITANVINALGNYMLVYGRWGAPAFGTNGSAYATLAARIYLASRREPCCYDIQIPLFKWEPLFPPYLACWDSINLVLSHKFGASFDASYTD